MIRGKYYATWFNDFIVPLREIWCTLCDMASPSSMLPERQVLWRVGGFGDDYYPPSSVWYWENAHRGPSSHCFFQMITKGEGLYTDDHERTVVPAGSAMLFAYGERSTYGKSPGSTKGLHTKWVGLLGLGVQEHWASLRKRHGSVIDIRGNEQITSGMDRLHELAAPRGTNDPVEMAAAAHDFVMALFRHAHDVRYAVQSPVERAVEQLLRNPTVGWSLKEVAAEHQVSREHLTRVFTKRVGKPPGQVLNEARLRRALHLLRNTALPVYEVARQSGFASAHTMARRVKQETNMSPMSVRELSG